jgi:hypothetical protein
METECVGIELERLDEGEHARIERDEVNVVPTTLPRAMSPRPRRAGTAILAISSPSTPATSGASARAAPGLLPAGR